MFRHGWSIVILAFLSGCGNANVGDPSPDDLPVFSIERCPADAQLELLSDEELVAPVGGLFSKHPFVPNRDNDYEPQALRVRVSDALNRPVTGCRLRWIPDRGSGWVYPLAEGTNADGIAEAWWVADRASTQQISVLLVRRDQSSDQVRVFGEASAHFTRANSTHINYDIPHAFDAVSVDVTPITFPYKTYYAALTFEGGYAGIQNRAENNRPDFDEKTVLFSVWDVPGGARAETVA